MYAPNAKPKPSIQKQRIFPTWDQIDTLRTPLIEGERTLAQFLDDNLPSEWEIYLQPFMNGDHPDIVILHPNVGLMIYEVKDWNLAHYERRRENDGDRCYVRDARGWHAIADPRRQVERYRENLAYLYAPYIGKEISDNRKTLGALPTGLYFHRATTAQAQAFVPSGRGGCTVIGHDALTPNNLKNVVPGVKYTTSGVFYSYWVDTPFSGIRAWLRPPFHVMEQSEPLGLTEEQKRHVSPSPGQHQRLRGVAGSGKTLVLAQRAANLAAAGKHVLVVTFNITLWHYIRDMVSRARVGFEWDRIEFTHFHGLCRNFLDENDEPWPSSDAVDTETLLNEIVPGLVIKMLQEGRNRKNRKYDAILIDEGQDFVRSYYDMLRYFLTDNDEVLFVADYRQNVYGRESSWLESMTNTKFRGRWRELRESYRLPAPVVREANRFAEAFLGDGEFSALPVPRPGLFDPLLVWQNVRDDVEVQQAVWSAFDWLRWAELINPVDIVVLVPSTKLGLELVRMFEKEHICTNHVFEEDEDEVDGNRKGAVKRPSKAHKRSFWMGNPCLKICTIHSFKGWELQNVIVVTPKGPRRDTETDSILYIALTRTRGNLIVLNRHPDYVEFGSTWASTWEDEE